jgi:methylenetetrahydrofolate dehydrogenase (NADP+)/methenyltetrahydrofolate cyclohydrolase/formyltetrahydrofolate synthetase
MIKKQKKGEEAPFILRFSSEPVHYRLPAPLHKELRITEVETDADDKSFQWAYSLKSGRPRNDEWELELKKGQKIKVLQDRGRDWLVVADTKGKIGFTHRSWLDFSGRQLRLNPLAAWNRFAEDASKIVQYGNLSEFPQLKKYMDTCTKAECMAVKENASSLGICAHDLRVLLEGSGCYAYEWVKNGRNMWHPDRFARHCMPEHAERLKVKAQELFVLYGTLMEGF